MEKKKTKKGIVKPLIEEALNEMRSVPEVIRYIRKKYGIEPHERSVYHHIDKIRKDKEDPNFRLVESGDKYQFISKINEKIADTQELKWFIEKYNDAFNNINQPELYLLRKELFEMCQYKELKDDFFIDFILENAKKDSYRYFDNLGIDLDKMTLITWDCILLLFTKYKDKKNIYKKINKIDIFFKNVIIDDEDNYYGVEKLEALSNIKKLYSFKAIEVAFYLLKNIDSKEKIIFSPNGKKINKYQLFKEDIHWIILYYSIHALFKIRQLLFEVYSIRKNKFGNKDIISKDIYNLIKILQSTEHKNKIDEINKWESSYELKILIKEYNLNKFI